jgi:hypothetical protein
MNGATKKHAARRAPARSATPLNAGSGFALAKVEMRSGDRYRVRTTGGLGLIADVAPGVERAFVDECLRQGRLVVLVDGEDRPTIAGALQTSRAFGVDPDGQLSVNASAIRLKAEQTLRIEAGEVAITVDRAGVLRLEGDKMVIDMGALIRLLSARVELP